MRSIDFYILNYFDYRHCQPFVCQLIDKAYQQGEAMTIYTESAEDARVLDDLLWSWQKTSFVPHQQISDTIMTVGRVNSDSSLLNINLCLPQSPQIQIDRPHWQRLLQIVPQLSQQLKSIARNHYRQYQQANYILTVYNDEK